MKQLLVFVFFIFSLTMAAQSTCTLSLDSIYIDNSESNCNSLVFKYNVSGGTATSYFWNYGDGNYCTCLHPKNFYTQNGNFQVCGRIEDGNACADSLCIQVTVNCSNPCDLSEIGIYSVDTLSYTCNEVEFITITSKNVKKIKWDFNDGDSSDQKYVIHTFKDNKTYNVRLIVQDSISCADTAIVQIAIDCPMTAPCDFNLNGIDTLTGLDCKRKQFTLRANKTPNYINWNYGDGTTSQDGLNSNHDYNDTGIYEVCVIAEDSFKCMDTLCIWVPVLCPSVDLIPFTITTTDLYPNPFNNILQIMTDSDAIIEIYDLSMRLLISQYLSSGSTEIDVSALNSGIFVIVLKTQSQIIYKRGIKE